MKRIMITGFSGFVSRHFLNYLFENKLSYQVLGVDMNEPRLDMSVYAELLDISFRQVNMLEAESLRRIISQFQPDYILHLASISSVAYSWQHPAECFNNNTRIFLNLTEAVREYVPECRILSVGSSEEYGNVSQEQLPLVEDRKLEPISPYAVARVSQEMMSKVLVDSFGMKIMLTRSFNHMGPYQDERFVIPSFVRRILNVAKDGKEQGTIETGDTSIIRDFVDVRDVVRAYYMLLTVGTPGEVYNICGGKGVALSEIIDEIADIVGVKIQGEVNPEFVRPEDNRVIIGSAEKLQKELGWKAEISLRKTLEDMVECMGRV